MNGFQFASGILLGLILCVSARAATEVTVVRTAELIRKAEKVADSDEWARDLLDILRQHDLPQSLENVCSVIAVVDQESGFVADPAVPGLGRLSEQALREKFGRIPIAGSLVLSFLENSPSQDDSYMERIRGARTERDLDLAYRRFVEDMSKRASLAMLVNSGLLNRMVEDRNDIDTAGSMQVSVKFALQTANARRWLPMTLSDAYGVRDQLYTRHGGLYYGIKQLLDYETGYDRKIYRFADYNAGRFASRNAAFQSIVAVLAKTRLALDGDLLIYDAGKVSVNSSSTEKALQRVSKRFKLGLSDVQIRADLLLGTVPDFAGTTSFLKTRALFQSRLGKVPPFAVLPQIELTGPKIKRKFTTADFASSVNRRYQSCLTNR